MKEYLLTVIIFFLVVFAVDSTVKGEIVNFELKSNAFDHMGKIPSRYTCLGDDISPDLYWQNPPTKTKSFVLISDDPDAPDPKAPKMTWVHWVVYDIPATVSSIPEAVDASEVMSTGGKHGVTDFKRLGYGGPCPPIGVHRYFFKLYALDKLLDLPPGKSKSEVEKAMQGHILDQATLIGKFSK